MKGIQIFPKKRKTKSVNMVMEGIKRREYCREPYKNVSQDENKDFSLIAQNKTSVCSYKSR